MKRMHTNCQEEKKDRMDYSACVLIPSTYHALSHCVKSVICYLSERCVVREERGIRLEEEFKYKSPSSYA